MPAIIYREATAEDAASIARVNSDTLRECGLEGPDVYSFDRLLDRWDRYLRGLHHPQYALEPRIAFAALAGDRMVGYIAGHFSRRHGSDGELQSIYVLRRHHSEGIGTSLLRELARWFVTNARASVCVGIAPENPYRRFYEKHGARYISRHWLIWDDIGTVLSE